VSWLLPSRKLYTLVYVSFLFLNNSDKNRPIIMIFDTRYLEKILHQWIINLPTSHVYCGVWPHYLEKCERVTRVCREIPTESIPWSEYFSICDFARVDINSTLDNILTA